MHEARGGEPCDGRECWPGFECTTEVSSCAPEELDCEPLVDTWCQSPDCAAGEACPDGMRCLVSESLCRPVYEFPCNTSGDCGPGFRCEPVETCDCAENAEPGSPACSCEPAGDKYCAFDVTACTPETESADCAPGFRCADNGQGLCNNPGDPHTGCNPGNPPFACVPPFLGTAAPGALSDGSASKDDPAPAGDEGGCSVGRSGTANGAWVIALLLAAAWRRVAERVSSRR